MNFFFFSLLIFQVLSHEIKVIDGIDKKGERGIASGLSYSEPDILYGPKALFLLNKYCFLTSIDRYEYSICLFQNITQRRLIGSSTTLLGLSLLLSSSSSSSHSSVLLLNNNSI